MSIILRIDDCGWVPPEKTPDRGLQYFRDYRAALGLQGRPVYYGFIPETLADDDIDQLGGLLTGDETVAVHGHDHAPNAVVQESQMRADRNRFLKCFEKVDSYIPPFNAYDDGTVANWRRAVEPGTSAYFFGGIPEDGNCLLPGLYPRTHGTWNVYHLPAIKELYGRVEHVLPVVYKYLDLKCPIVLTLHATWDHLRFDDLHRLGKILSQHLVGVESVREWINSSDYHHWIKHSGAATAAFDYVLDSVRPGMKVFDFGCRDGLLPRQLAMRGCRVECCDRDLAAVNNQRSMLRDFGLESVSRVWHWDGIDPPTTAAAHYDLISATWSIQHNDLERIPVIVANLARMLAPGGTIKIVSSFTNSIRFYQENRADPQWVLDRPSIESLIVEPSGLELLRFVPFLYSHGKSGYAATDTTIANAVAYTLGKRN